MANFQFTFGEAALEGWLQGRKSADQRAQFEMEQNRLERQEGLMNMFRQADDWRQQQLVNAQITNMNTDNQRLAESLTARENQFNETMDYKNKALEEKQQYGEKLNEIRQQVADLKANGGLTPYQQEMKDRYEQKVEENRSKGQTFYNEQMDVPYIKNEDLGKINSQIKPNPNGKGAYVRTKSDGTVEVFYSDKSLESDVKKQLLKNKLYVKGLNLWSRQGQDPSIKTKYADDFQALIKKGYSEQEAIDMIKKNYGIK